MKNYIIVLLFCFNFAFGQGKYLTRCGSLTFEASMPAFEEVKAKNESVTAIFNSGNGKIAVLALIRGFRFKNALMEEHFNESYIESSQFPKATFRGKIDTFVISHSQEVDLTGILEMHGVEKPVNTIAKYKLTDQEVIISGAFLVKASDFDIKIPKIVRNKVSDTVSIQFDLRLIKKSD